MTVSPHNTVGELASRFPETIRVFQRLRVEFCCEGQRRLEDLCRERQLSFDELAAALRAAVAAPRIPQHDWSTRLLSDLTSHIVEAFHEPLRLELPRLHQIAVKVQGHSDASKPVLGVILYELARFWAELDPHMRREEQDLFPLICRVEVGPQRDDDRVLFNHLRSAFEADHAAAGHALQILRLVTDRSDLSAHGCTSVRALCRGLRELEQLMQLHIHLENNILFPRAAALLSEAGIERS